MSFSATLSPGLQSIEHFLGGDEITSNFFQEELGQLGPFPDTDLKSTSTVATNRTSMHSVLGFSLGRRASRAASTDHTKPNTAQLITLEQLCGFIFSYPSLQSAGIVFCSSYTEPTRLLSIPDRFLVLELDRDGRQNIWLRIDRRPSDKARGLGFTLGSSITPAKDTAMLASSLEQLLAGSPDAVEENRLRFQSPGLLSNIRPRLLDITAVMNQYKRTTENCWVFYAHLLRSFEVYDKAKLWTGELRYPTLARSLKRQILQAEADRRKEIHQQLAPILSPHDPSLYIPLSILYHDLGKHRDKTVEAARCWENSDDFSSAEGRQLAQKLIQFLYLYISNNPDSQVALESTALCRHVALSGASSSALNPSDRDRCFLALYLHGQRYQGHTPPNPAAAQRLFEEATLLLVPGLIKNQHVCLLRYRHAIVLYDLDLWEEAMEMVMAFIECVRHEHVINTYRDLVKDLRSRGLWPAEFDYIVQLEKGDLSRWDRWQEN